MIIREVSDIHLEFGYLDLPVMENEDQQVLVLAGDVGIASKSYTFMPFLEEVSERFQDVIYILGNHEHYHGSVVRSLDKIKSHIDHAGNIHNVHVVNNETVRINNVSFVCSTLWASFDNGNPMVMNDAQNMMNDHRIIRTGTPEAPYLSKFLPQDAFAEHQKAVDYIFSAIKEEKEKGQKVVMVVHHAPSKQSVHPKYKTGPFATINGAYSSDLDDKILDAQPDLIFHGHTHENFDYMIGDTRVVCNPRGYVKHEENFSFDPELVISI